MDASPNADQLSRPTSNSNPKPPMVRPSLSAFSSPGFRSRTSSISSTFTNKSPAPPETPAKARLSLPLPQSTPIHRLPLTNASLFNAVSTSAPPTNFQFKKLSTPIHAPRTPFPESPVEADDEFALFLASSPSRKRVPRLFQQALEMDETSANSSWSGMGIDHLDDEDNDDVEDEFNRITPTAELCKQPMRKKSNVTIEALHSPPSNMYGIVKEPIVFKLHSADGKLQSMEMESLRTPADAAMRQSIDPSIHILDSKTLKQLDSWGYQYPHQINTLEPEEHIDYLTHKYKILHRIGRGAFADVFKLERLPDQTLDGDHTLRHKPAHPQWYALKKSRSPITGSRDRRAKLEEVVILQALQGCKNVVQHVEAWEQYSCLHMVMEFCTGGDLASFLDRKSKERVSINGTGLAIVEEIAVWGVLAQVSQGLLEMHTRNIVHLDLKPSNIFITENGMLKVGDFGCATMLPVSLGFEREGDRTYMAPEVMESRYCFESDIFSLGLIIFEMSTNVILPENGNHWQKLRKLDFSEFNDTLMRQVSPPLLSMMKHMMQPNPSQRVSVAEILRHPFVGAVVEAEGLFL